MNQTSDREVQKLISLFTKFGQYDMKMQVGTALVLLYVARHQDTPDGITSGDLMRWLGFAPAVASRNVRYWGEGVDEMPNAGYRLIAQHPDPLDRRRLLLRLTPRGEAFVRQLKEVLHG